MLGKGTVARARFTVMTPLLSDPHWSKTFVDVHVKRLRTPGAHELQAMSPTVGLVRSLGGRIKVELHPSLRLLAGWTIKCS